MGIEKFKVLETIDGVDYIFNYLFFSMKLTTEAKKRVEMGECANVSKFYELIAKKVRVSDSAIKQWAAGRNGVSDLERVKDIARFFGIENYRDFLIAKSENSQVKITDEERKTAKAVFEAMVDVILIFFWTDGNKGGFTDKEYSIAETAEKIIKKSRFELPKDVFDQVNYLHTEVTTTFMDFIAEDMSSQEEAILLGEMTEQFYDKLHECMNRYLR